VPGTSASLRFPTIWRCVRHRAVRYTRVSGLRTAKQLTICEPTIWIPSQFLTPIVLNAATVQERAGEMVRRSNKICAGASEFAWGNCLDRQSVNVGLHQLVQGVVNQAMPTDARQAGEVL
jgi:hypothetical protein